MVFVLTRDVVVVALIATLLLCPIALLWKFDVISEESIFLPGSWALFTASLIATKMKLKARLFYIFPTWILTLSCAIYTSYSFWGSTINFAKNGIFIVVLLALFSIFFVFISEKKQIKNLNLKAIDIPNKSNGVLEYWIGIKKLFFFPLFSKWDKNVYEYNIRVLLELKKNNIELRYSEDLRNEMLRMEENLLIGNKHVFNKKIKDDFFSDIDYQIKIW